MKNLFIAIMVLLSTHLVAQEYTFISKDLHLMTEAEMIDNEVQFTNDVMMYDTDGNKIEASQMGALMTSDNFVPQIYGDKNHEVKAVVFRAATKEEKEALKKENSKDPNANFVPGSFATYFTAVDITGKEISLKELRGKVVVLNFWYSDCTACIADMPELNKLVEKYSDVAFISITFDTKAEAEKTVKTNAFKYKVIANAEDTLVEYGTLAFPTHLIIDKTGEIVFRKIGSFITEMDDKIGILTK